ncbi:hypothetical protein ACSBOB_00725 [Mesorhizobium sp. ASY16-5R]|uniref:hypothetical protein n=1 Tax=Mesorhizobium sp. ASY16-5R TaxID=3445772 RepID=UPI003F9FD404
MIGPFVVMCSPSSGKLGHDDGSPLSIGGSAFGSGTMEVTKKVGTYCAAKSYPSAACRKIGAGSVPLKALSGADWHQKVAIND